MFNSSCFVLFIAIVNAILTGVEPQLQCRDEENQPVDWFVMYKIPKISQSSNPLIKNGEAYIYMTSDNADSGWKVSKKSISSNTSIPGYTLAPLYPETNSNSILWTLYNDDAPNKSASGYYGHTKGVAMADAQQGFWLIHSVPGFPPAPDHGTDPPERARSERSVDFISLSDPEYEYPQSGKTYGQSFLCVSVNKDQIDLIGTQFMYNQIIPYKNNLPQKLAEQYPIMTKAANKIRVKNAPYKHRTSFTSLGGVKFLSFAKSDKWQKDLYEDFVAPQLGLELLAETWPNSRNRLPSDCSGSRVLNIESINIEEVNVVFKATHDHSKWAVSNTGKKNKTWVCIGDINRAEAQLGRGGGTVCLNSAHIWKSYRDIINDVEPCPTNHRSKKN